MPIEPAKMIMWLKNVDRQLLIQGPDFAFLITSLLSLKMMQLVLVVNIRYKQAGRIRFLWDQRHWY